MKTLTNYLGVALAALILSACGNSVMPALTNNPYGNNQWGNQTGNPQNFQGGCVPLQNGSIPFTIQGAAVSSAVILGGNLPQVSFNPITYGQSTSVHPGTYGQSAIGMGGMGGQGMIQYAPFQSSAGTIQLTASMGGGQGGLVSGTINMSQTTLYQILGATANMGAYMNSQQQFPNQGFNNNVCISSVAIHVVHQVFNSGFNGMGQIYSAQVYLYLNNSQMAIGPISFF